MSIKLYIDNKEVDLWGSTDSLKLNKQATDAINPSTIKTDTSKTITVPRTPSNNNIFSQYYRFDKILTVTDFNPNQKVPYILMSNSAVLMSGYLKMTSVTDTEYSITLFDETADKIRSIAEQKLTDVLPSMSHTINKEYIIDSWDHISTAGSTDIKDYVTYVPAYKGTYEDFNSAKVQVTSSNITDLGYEVDEFDRQEFRSYYQCPAVYLNKIIKSIADYNNIRLHNTFHNETNPYWNDTVVMFPKLLTDNDVLNQSTFTMEQLGIVNYSVDASGELIQNYTASMKYFEVYDPYDVVNPTSPDVLNLDNYPSGTVKIDYEFKVKLKFTGSPAAYANKQLTPVHRAIPDSLNLFRITAFAEGQTNVHTTYEYAYPNLTYPTIGFLGGPLAVNTDSSGEGYFTHYKKYSPTIGLYDSAGDIITIKGQAYVPTSAPTTIKFKIDIYSRFTSTPPGVMAMANTSSPQTPLSGFFYITSEIVDANLSTCTVSVVDKLRSNSTVNKYNIIPKDLKVQEFLLNYIKHFNLVLDKDKDGFIIKDKNTYYSEGKVHDWTYKIDRGSEIILTPLPFENKYLNIEYTPNETTHYKNYNKFSDVGYASKRINTNYEFNETTDTLFKSIFYAPLISQEYTLNRSINKWSRMEYVSPAMHTIDNEKKNRADSKYTLLFKGTSTVLPEYHTEIPTVNTNISVTDDTDIMKTNSEYTWLNPSYGITYKDTYGNNLFPYFSILTEDKQYSLEFGKNSRYYTTSINDYNYNEETTIYDQLFKKYLEDRYNFNTKILSCYVNLSIPEFNTLRLCDFVVIDSVLFSIYKISDFDVLTPGLTKVELIKVNDISNYLNGQNLPESLYRSYSLRVSELGNLLVMADVRDPNISYVIDGNNLLAEGPAGITENNIFINDNGYLILN